MDATVEALCGDLARIRARGTELAARSWQTEAPLRMLLNNLDAEVAEHPGSLVVYGGLGKAARDHPSLKALVRTLLRLGDDETMLVQSGKPVGVFRTHPQAPRVLISNAMLVPRWATWDEFRRLEALGLTMFGQMTAGSWIYIGTQGILQGTYQTFAAAAEQHFGQDDLRGRHGVDGRGSAGWGARSPWRRRCSTAPSSASRSTVRIERRLRRATSTRPPSRSTRRSIWFGRRPPKVGVCRRGLLGNAADVVPGAARRGEHFDLVTDQTAAHDPLTGYVPQGLDVGQAAALRASDPDEYLRRARESIAAHVRGLLEYVRQGSYVLIMATTCEVRPVKPV